MSVAAAATGHPQNMVKQIFTKDKAAVTRDVSGETVIVPVRSGVADLNAIFVLNETATWIWAQLDGKRSLNDLADGLAGEFDIARGQAEKDVLNFLAGLKAEGLVNAV